MPKRKFLDSRKFEFSEETTEIARNIYNFQKSGFDSTLLGASNLGPKDRKRVDQTLNNLAPAPKKTALAQVQAFKALPSPEDQLVVQELKRRTGKKNKIQSRRSLF